MSDKFTMHVDVDAFLPATEEEKEYMVQMRPSSLSSGTASSGFSRTVWLPSP